MACAANCGGHEGAHGPWRHLVCEYIHPEEGFVSRGWSIIHANVCLRLRAFDSLRPVHLIVPSLVADMAPEIMLKPAPSGRCNEVALLVNSERMRGVKMALCLFGVEHDGS